MPMGRDNRMMRGPHNVSQKQWLKTMGIFGLGKNRKASRGTHHLSLSGTLPMLALRVPYPRASLSPGQTRVVGHSG